MTEFEKEAFVRAVHEIVKMIPSGRATSYGAIAKAVGYPNMSRLVGRIMGACDLSVIPVHRVVNSQGILSGSETCGNSGRRQKRLEEEGVVVINNKIQNWKIIFWNPMDEILFNEIN